MLPIQKMHIHVNEFSRPGSKLKAKRGIVMHYSGSPGAAAKNIDRYFDELRNQNPNDNKSDTYASAQYSVDRFNIIEVIPPDEMAYHCGSKTYTPEALQMFGSYPNNSTIGIEMCIEKDGSIHEDTFQNAADLVAHLIQNEGFPEVIFTHKGVVGWKDCPLPWIENPSEFERFKKGVHDRLYPNDEEEIELKFEHDWQWKMLGDSLDGLYRKGLIGDYSWAEKAYEGKLTQSELSWLNMIVYARSNGIEV